MSRVRSQIAHERETAVRVMRDTGGRRLAEERARLLTSFTSYMRFTHRYGPRTRWRDGEGRWHVRGRVERFLEPALLLLLAERRAHGYELVDRVAELVPGERPELGGLYRILRALEEDGLVRSEWDADEPGPAKRTYELTPAGHDLLRAWAKALRQTQAVVDAFLQRLEGR
jgi:poly-beta-hydroxybutyrate-responsive repressor